MTDLHQRILALPPEKRAELERRLAQSARRAPAPGIEPRADPARPCPLSFSQQRIWFMSQVRPPFNPPSVIDVTGELDLPALRAAFAALVARHEVLRTVVEVRDGVPVQRALPPTGVPVAVHDLRDLPGPEQERAVERLAEAETHRAFDLGRDLMLRVGLARLAAQRHVLLLTIHHIAVDAWALGVLVRELAALYEAFAAGEPSPLAPLSIQYADFALWQRERLSGDHLERHLAYWREQLGDSPPRLVLPVDHARPQGQALAGSAHEIALPAGLVARLKALADGEGATVFMTLLAAVAALLHRHSGQHDLVLGSTIANRGAPATAGLIGCFVNTIALRTDVSGDPSFRELLGRVRQTTLGAYEHQELPFEKLVNELHPERDTSQAPIVQLVVNYDNTPREPMECAGLRLHLRPLHMDVVHFDLTLTITPAADPGGLLCSWEYNADIFEADTVAQLAGRWRALLEQAVADPDRRVGDLDLLDEQDRRRLAAWQGTVGEVPGATVCQLFEERAVRAPDAEAVALGGVALTYAQLNARANQLAHFLRANGVGTRTLVGICVDRSVELAVGILGVLKAGGAYVPLDPGYPAERLEYMLDDAAVAVLLTQEHLRRLLPERGAPVVALDADWPRIAGRPDHNPPPAATGTDLAYVIYTSGSTGRPKGVQVEHRSLANYTLAAVDAFDLVPADRVLQFASLGFDVLVEELFPTWLAGATVVLVPERVLGAVDLARLTDTERLTVFELPTAYWHEWVNTLERDGTTLPGCLRLVIVGGERILPDRLATWQRTGVPLTHVFGLTETTVTTTTFRLPADAGPDLRHNLPIGRPWPNMRVHVLDGRMRPVPVGVPGELFIGGAGVARGYLNRPELTAERFVEDPFGADPGGRLYRTGDLVRWRRTGDLEFIGRIDAQLKVRGYRVEPAEIEAALGRHPDLREMVVVAREDVPGDRRLTAYVVPVPGRQQPDAGELRRFLERSLPAYLVPSAFVTLDALPTTRHGKVDRAALPAPDGARPRLAEEYVAPADPAEVTLAGIWADVIGVDRVGVHDNFFEIGGDSILSIQIVARAQAAGLRLTPMDIFRFPTVAQLAGHTESGGAGPVAVAEPATGSFPLLPIQRWFFAQGFPAPAHWNMAALLEVRADYGEPLLRTALDALLDHHDGLRQRFERDTDGTIRGRVAEPGQPCPFDVFDLAHLPPAERGPAVERHATGVQAGLDLQAGPLVRAALFHLGAGLPPRLLVVAHHLVVDAVSWRILLADLQLACELLRRGEPAVLPPRTTPFVGWARRLAEYASGPGLAAQVAYWREVTAAATPLPVDFPQARAHNTVGEAATVSVVLERDLTEALLHEVPAAFHTQINDVLLAALALALHRWSGSPAHLVEVEGHGREDILDGVDLSRTVGWFTAVYPVRLEVRPADGPADVVKRAKERLRQVPHGGTGYLTLRENGMLHDSGALPTGATAEIAFSYFGQFDQLLRADGPFVPAADRPGQGEDPAGRRPHLLEVAAEIRDGRLRVGWRYGRLVQRRERIEELAQAYLAELTALIEHRRTAGDIGFTPSDFPGARLSQSTLDNLLARLTGGSGEQP